MTETSRHTGDAEPGDTDNGGSMALTPAGLRRRVTRAKATQAPARIAAPDPVAQPNGDAGDASASKEATEEQATSAPGARGLEGVWDPAVLADRENRKHLNRWQQGDLIRGIPISWVALPGLDELTNMECDVTVVDPDAGDRLPVVTWHELNADGNRATSVRGWAVVISQTCDIVGKGPGARHPTVQVAPLVCGTGAMNVERIKAAKEGRVVELAYVPAMTDREGGDWFADLRLSVPVSKSVLIETEPIRGFTHDRDRLNLAEKTASKYRRPATHDAVSEYLTSELSAYIAAARHAGTYWFEQIEQVRVHVREGDRLWPTKLQIVAIGHTKLDDDAKAAMRTFRQTRKKTFKNQTRDADFAPHGCELTAVRFTDVAALGVAAYRDTVPLEVEGLDGTYW